MAKDGVMKKKLELSRLVFSFVFAAVIVSPFIVVLCRTQYVSFPAWKEIAGILASTTMQAGLSASLSLVFGFMGGMGFNWVCSRFRKKTSWIVESVVLLPNIAPVLILLLSVLKFFPWARGLIGISFVHTLLNAGIVSVAVAHLSQSKLSGLSELAYVEGVGKFRFIFRVALPILRTDLSVLFMFVFAICFSSFAIPLAMGGSRATTIEVLIYEKIRVSGDWSQALGLTFIQTALIFLVSMASWGNQKPIHSISRPLPPILQLKFGLIPVVFPSVLILIGLCDGVLVGYKQFLGMDQIHPEILGLIAGSTFIGLTTGFGVVAMMLLIAYLNPSGKFRKFLLGYAAPSATIIGFALLLVWRSFGIASYVKIAFGICLISIPQFYRLRWDSILQNLNPQLVVARTLGATPCLSFLRIVFPQVVSHACGLGGVAALWAWGDFALSSIVAERNLTIAQTIHGMMGSYRFDVATFFVWIALMGGITTYSLFVGAGHVLGAKSQA